MERALSKTNEWNAGRAHELTFWHQVIFNTREQPQAYHDELISRVDREKSLRVDLENHLLAMNVSSAKILDVAAGPVSCVGWKSEICDIDVTAIDALADDFNKMLDKASLPPPVKTRACDAECVHEIFPRDYFDLALIRNALDHCYDPLAVIRSVIAVLKPKGCFIIEGFVNEAEHEGYVGFHQWNINTQNGELIIASKSHSHALPQALDLPIKVVIEEYNPPSRWIRAVIRKEVST